MKLLNSKALLTITFLIAHLANGEREEQTGLRGSAIQGTDSDFLTRELALKKKKNKYPDRAPNPYKILCPEGCFFGSSYGEEYVTKSCSTDDGRPGTQKCRVTTISCICDQGGGKTVSDENCNECSPSEVSEGPIKTGPGEEDDDEGGILNPP